MPSLMAPSVADKRKKSGIKSKPISVKDIQSNQNTERAKWVYRIEEKD